jgi:NADPH:quinone reductase-like Zn-dependent oxidoreductase
MKAVYYERKGPAVKAIETRRYRPHVAGIYKLDETAKAHEAQESGGTVGKLLINV